MKWTQKKIFKKVYIIAFFSNGIKVLEPFAAYKFSKFVSLNYHGPNIIRNVASSLKA
jgi:hypothetical protein